EPRPRSGAWSIRSYRSAASRPPGRTSPPPATPTTSRAAGSASASSTRRWRRATSRPWPTFWPPRAGCSPPGTPKPGSATRWRGSAPADGRRSTPAGSRSAGIGSGRRPRLLRPGQRSAHLVEQPLEAVSTGGQAAAELGVVGVGDLHAEVADGHVEHLLEGSGVVVGEFELHASTSTPFP